MENSIGRNKIMHTHEIIHQLMHWWDDVVFEKYPTWGKLLKANENNELQDQAVNFNRLDLETYFGKQDENGPGNYTQGVKYGIGSEVITKMLSGAEKQNDIKEALAALEPTARRKQGLTFEKYLSNSTSSIKLRLILGASLGKILFLQAIPAPRARGRTANHDLQ